MRISDWSSDVCSSDLRHNLAARPYAFVHLDDTLVQHLRQHDVPVEQPRARLVADPERVAEPLGDHQDGALALALQEEIGRASCRERVCPSVLIRVVAVSLKNKKLNKRI